MTEESSREAHHIGQHIPVLRIGHDIAATCGKDEVKHLTKHLLHSTPGSWGDAFDELGKLFAILCKHSLCMALAQVIDPFPDAVPCSQSGHLHIHSLCHSVYSSRQTGWHIPCLLGGSLNGAAKLLTVPALRCKGLLGALIYRHLEHGLLIVGCHP